MKIHQNFIEIDKTGIELRIGKYTHSRRENFFTSGGLYDNLRHENHLCSFCFCNLEQI